MKTQITELKERMINIRIKLFEYGHLVYKVAGSPRRETLRGKNAYHSRCTQYTNKCKHSTFAYWDIQLPLLDKWCAKRNWQTHDKLNIYEKEYSLDSI